MQLPSIPLSLDEKTLDEAWPVSAIRYVQEYRPGQTLHYHNCLEIGLCDEGSGVEMIDQQVYAFSARHLSVLPAGCIHDAHVTAKTEGEAGSVWRFFFVDTQKLGLEADFAGFLCADEVLVTLFELMYRAAEEKDMFRHLLAAFLIRARQLAPGVCVRPQPEMALLLSYIGTHYREALTTQSLSRVCRMSESSFCRAFNASFSMPPMRYVQRMRLTVAAHLLRSSRLSILEISQEAGYRTLSSFNRQFKKEYGMPPRQYRG